MTSIFNFRSLGSLLLWGLTPLLIGWWLAQSLIPQPAVGIIRLNDEMWLGSAELVRLQIEKVHQDPSIKAVVFQLNSPGGSVSASQVVYLELQNLRRQMPVVTSIDTLAASGGFYAAVATDPIYTTPSSTVGNVGAIAITRPDPVVEESVLTSGPFKLTAGNQQESSRQVEIIKQEFLSTVFSQRGDRLTLSRAELSQGLAYQGREAVDLGLVDYLGSQSEAIDKAAELAGIAHYQVVDLQKAVFDDFAEAQTSYSETWPDSSNPLASHGDLPYGIYLFYNTQQRGAW